MARTRDRRFRESNGVSIGVNRWAGRAKCLPALCLSAHLFVARRVSPVVSRPPHLALDVHIVTHTHWDREWYHPLERFRQRLVALVDELIDDPPSSRESFLLDGQAIILE